MAIKWMWVLLLPFAILSACTRAEEPAPSQAPPSPAAVAAPTEPGAASPAAAPEPEDEDEDEDDDDDFDEPLDTDFEIDASASRYFGWVPMTVAFGARALNGTPPFTYTWDFGDGSPPATGETATHTYTKLGSISAFATGQDASGEKSRVQLVIFTVTPEEYSQRKNVPLERLLASPAPAASPESGGAGPAPGAGAGKAAGDQPAEAGATGAAADPPAEAGATDETP